MTRAAVIRVAVSAAAALAVLTAIAAAAPPARDAVTDATAAIATISVPGQTPVVLGGVDWPASVSAEVQAFSYPSDGSVLTVGLSRASASAQTGPAASALASAQTASVSIFGGEIQATHLNAKASAGAGARSAGADVASSGVQGLRALGQDLGSSSASVALADWGSLQVLGEDTGSRRSGGSAAQGSLAVLRIVLTTTHGGLPAGS